MALTASRFLDRPARVLVDGTLSDPPLDHPEGVAVAADGSIWCGGERGQIFRIDPDAGEIVQVASTDGFCLGLAFGPDDRLYVCDLKHAAVMRVDPATGAVERFANGADGERLRMPNFPAFDAAGRLYVSDSRGRGDPGPGVFRFEIDGAGELWCTQPIHFANGLALAADGSALYVVETWERRVLRVPIDERGAAGPIEPFVELPRALPDGLAFASDGALYVGCYEPSQVLRVEPDGSVGVVAADADAHLLCHPTNVAFLGDRLVAANLGRWHLTVIDAGIGGAPLPFPTGP